MLNKKKEFYKPMIVVLKGSVADPDPYDPYNERPPASRSAWRHADPDPNPGGKDGRNSKSLGSF